VICDLEFFYIVFLHIRPLSFTLRTLSMAIFACRRGNESNEALQQRFKKQLQRSGVMKLLRNRSAFRKKPNKRITRNRALKREEYRARNRKKQFYSNM